MANGVISEWEEIHIKRGNYVERPKEINPHEVNKEIQEKLKEKTREDFNKKLDDDDLEALMDELEDLDVFKSHKEQMLQQVKENESKPYFGSVQEISRAEYVEQINNAPADVWVILNMYQNYNEKSILINQWMEQLSKQYPRVKFVKIVATNCVEKFPDSNVPCLIIYKNGKNVMNMPSFDKYLQKMNITEFQKFLHFQNIIRNEDFEEWEESVKSAQQQLKNPYKQSNTQFMDDLDDREYQDDSLKQYKKF